MTTRITVRDADQSEAVPGEEAIITDNYFIVADGSVEFGNVQVHRKANGTETHVVTIKGIRQGGAA